jgi:hypothetical protein
MTKSDVKIPAQGPGAPPEAPPAPPNGPAPESPAQGPQLPPGTIQLPPPTAARLVGYLRESRAVQDALMSFLEGKGETGPYSLVVPVFLLVRPQESSGQ